MSDPIFGGVLTGSAHHLPARVYWEDTDAGGIVYHASYIRFMERGRTEFLRALGLDQSALAQLPAESRVLFVVRHIAIDYLRPAKLDDLLDVVTHALHTGGARLELKQIVRRGAETIAEARVTVVSIGGDGRPRRIPDHVRDVLQPLIPVAAEGAAVGRG
jgi:acyl-CoA thioester hydrolase